MFVIVNFVSPFYGKSCPADFHLFWKNNKTIWKRQARDDERKKKKYIYTYINCKETVTLLHYCWAKLLEERVYAALTFTFNILRHFLLHLWKLSGVCLAERKAALCCLVYSGKGTLVLAALSQSADHHDGRTLHKRSTFVLQRTTLKKCLKIARKTLIKSIVLQAIRKV